MLIKSLEIEINYAEASLSGSQKLNITSAADFLFSLNIYISYQDIHRESYERF